MHPPTHTRANFILLFLWYFTCAHVLVLDGYIARARVVVGGGGVGKIIYPADRWRAPVARALPAFTRWRLLDTPAAAPRAGAKFYNILPSAVCLCRLCVCVCVIHFFGQRRRHVSLSLLSVYIIPRQTNSCRLCLQPPPTTCVHAHNTYIYILLL